MGASWLYVINDVQGGSVTDIEPGLEFVDQLINEQDAVVMENTDAGLRLFQNEEILVAPYWSARTDQIELESDIETTFVYPDEGAFKSFYNLSMVGGRGDARQEAAADFVSSTLIPERQAKFSSSFGYPPTNPDAVQYMDEQAVADRPSLEISERDMENMAKIEIDWVEVTNRRAQHAERWRQIVRG
jgi:spermidine/putrescine-binding protein